MLARVCPHCSELTTLTWDGDRCPRHKLVQAVLADRIEYKKFGDEELRAVRRVSRHLSRQ